MKFAGTVLWEDIISRNPSMRGKAGAGKRAKMVAALAKVRNSPRPFLIDHSVLEAFVWDGTVQGFDFWNKVYSGRF